MELYSDEEELYQNLMDQCEHNENARSYGEPYDRDNILDIFLDNEQLRIRFASYMPRLVAHATCLIVKPNY